MLPIIYKNPNMEFESVLTLLKFKKRTKEELYAPIEFLVEKFKEINKKPDTNDLPKWVMGQMHSMALGNINMKDLYEEVFRRIS